MPTFLAPDRTPLTIRDGAVDIGGDVRRFAPDDRESILHSYLSLVRRVRDQRREPSITLRRGDIDTLAAHLGESAEHVVERLGQLMGATRSQRTAMLTMFATGAMLIAATAPAAAASSPGADSFGTHVAPGAGTPAPPTVVATTPRVAPTPEPSTASAATAATTRVAPSAGSGVQHARAATPAAASEVDAARDHTPSGSADDEPTLGQPGTTDDGTTVAVGLPPVPPPATGTTDDGTTVAVGLPPVPPPATGTTDDGTTVAVGLPPVPPPANG